MLRPILETGPLIIFFVVNAKAGIFAATGAFIVTNIIGSLLIYALTRHLTITSLITTVFVLVFGGLTLYLQDESFIKLKITIVCLLFASILTIGMTTERLFLKTLMGEQIKLHDEGWRQFTWRLILFFISLALLNEIVWRNTSTDLWVTFKTFGVLPLTCLFFIAQTPLIHRYQKDMDT